MTGCAKLASPEGRGEPTVCLKGMGETMRIEVHRKSCRVRSYREGRLKQLYESYISFRLLPRAARFVFCIFELSKRLKGELSCQGIVRVVCVGRKILARCADPVRSHQRNSLGGKRLLNHAQ